MTDAKLKSFTRTIREHMPHLIRNRVSIRTAPAGLIARAGLYRVKSREIIDRFMSAKRQIVYMNFGFPDHEQYEEYFQRLTIGCFYLDQAPNRQKRGILKRTAIATVVMPISHEFAVIQDSLPPVERQLGAIPDVPWSIRFFHRNPARWSMWGWSHDLTARDPLPFSDAGFRRAIND